MMAYFNEEFNSRLHKRQKAPTTAGDTNNSQPFPDLPPNPQSPNNEPAKEKNGGVGGIGKLPLIGIIVGALVVLGILIGFFVRKKIRERRTRNVIRINDTEWDGNTSTVKLNRNIPPQQLRNVYNGQNIEGEKSQPSMMVKNSPLSSPQFSNFSHSSSHSSSRDQDDASTLNITSPLELTPTKSEFGDSNFQQEELFYPNVTYRDNLPSPIKQRRFPTSPKGPYQHLPRSPRSPLIFKNKITNSTDSDSEQDTLEGTPRSPYFFKGESSINDQTLEEPPRSPYYYKGGPVPNNNNNNNNNNKTNDQGSTYLSHQDELDKTLQNSSIVNNNNNNNNNNYNNNNNNYNNYNYNYNYEEKNNNIKHENISKESNVDKNEIIMQLDSDLDNIITNLNAKISEESQLKEQYRQQYRNNLSPSSLKNEEETLALNLPSPLKFSWIKDSTYFLTPPNNNEESNGPSPIINEESQSQTNSIYSESSIGMNENVQMDYVQPTQGMIQIEMIDDHVITKNDIRSIKTNFAVTEESEFDSPQSEYMAIEYMPMENASQSKMMQTIEPIENEFVESDQTNIKMEISAPIVTGTTKPEILSSKPVVIPVSSTPISPMYDIDSLRRHAEKVLKAKTAKKEDEVNENDKNNQSSNEETQGQPLVRKKSVRFQAGLDNEEIPIVSNSVARKSILVVKNYEQSESDDDYEPEPEVNNRDSTSSASSYQVYDFDISSYQI